MNTCYVDSDMFNKFVVDYWKGGTNDEYKHQRFGQAFMNEFFACGLIDNELFYEPSTVKAMEHITENYINYEQHVSTCE